MTIYFVLVGSVAFISVFLVFKLGKRLERQKYSTTLKAWECLEKQALKRGGVIAVDKETLRTELSFWHDEIKIGVSILPGREFATYATFQSDFFPHKDFRFASKRFRALINPLRTEKFSGDLLPGFGVEGNSTSFVKSLLTQEIQTNLLQYDEATEVTFGDRGGINHLALYPNPGRVFFSIYGNKVEDKDYDQLIETAVLFYEQLKFMATGEAVNQLEKDFADGKKMSKDKKYNSSDAWLLLAIIYAGGENNIAPLEGIISTGDWINHAVFNEDEFESGLSRLTAGKFIKEKNGNFSVTPKVYRAFDKISSHETTVEKELEGLSEFIGAASPTSEQPQINNLKYEGFSQERFREAVNKYFDSFEHSELS